MKTMLWAAAIAAALATLPAVSMAACASPSTRVNTIGSLSALLQGNTVCVPIVTQPVMTWQEEHRAGGALWDYKKGPSDKLDPSKQEGTWAINGSNARSVFVTYDYGGGQIYSYSVWDNHDGSYSFCSANPEIKARIKTGSGPC